MTIKLEQEAIVRILDTARSPLSCHPHHPLKPPTSGGLRRPAPYADVGAGKAVGDSYCPDLLSLESDEDCISLSSYGSASSCDGGSTERRVSFAAPLVTEVKTRPRTKESDKGLLFYTQTETDRFRQTYREERLSSDHVQNVDSSDSSSDKEPPSSEGGRRRISRVVVEHQDSFETFYDLNDLSSYSVQDGGASMDDVFFDNDSFWSGSITWY